MFIDNINESLRSEEYKPFATSFHYAVSDIIVTCKGKTCKIWHINNAVIDWNKSKEKVMTAQTVQSIRRKH